MRREKVSLHIFPKVVGTFGSKENERVAPLLLSGLSVTAAQRTLARISSLSLTSSAGASANYRHNPEKDVAERRQTNIDPYGTTLDQFERKGKFLSSSPSHLEIS